VPLGPRAEFGVKLDERSGSRRPGRGPARPATHAARGDAAARCRWTARGRRWPRKGPGR